MKTNQQEKPNDLLLVIDMQNIYTTGQEWACLDTEGAAERINRIIDTGVCFDVIFTRFIASSSNVESNMRSILELESSFVYTLMSISPGIFP